MGLVTFQTSVGFGSGLMTEIAADKIADIHMTARTQISDLCEQESSILAGMRLMAVCTATLRRRMDGSAFRSGRGDVVAGAAQL